MRAFTRSAWAARPPATSPSVNRQQPPLETAGCSEGDQAIRKSYSSNRRHTKRKEILLFSFRSSAGSMAGSAILEAALLLRERSRQKHHAGNQSKTVTFPLHLGRDAPANLISRKQAGTNYQKSPPHSSVRLVLHKGRMDQLSPQTVLREMRIWQESCAPTSRISASVLAKRLGTTTKQTPAPFASAHTMGLRANRGNS